MPLLYKILSSINEISPKAKQTLCNNTPNPQPCPLHLGDDFKVKDEGRLSVPPKGSSCGREWRFPSGLSLESAGQGEPRTGLGGKEPLNSSHPAERSDFHIRF